MNETLNYSSKSLDHLGLVSGMIDELGIVESIDSHLSIDGINRDVSLGTLCKSLIINGLGFSQRTLYMVSSFFSNKPIELLLGPDIDSSQLNDTSLGRCLDAIYSYGSTTLYANITPIICKKLGLEPKIVHMDSTDFHLDGVYNSRQESVGESVIHLRHGYSRDHRPDLNQVVLNLIVENQTGIALHMEALSGNVSDKTAFTQTITNHISQLQSVYDIDYVVMDSAGYTKKTLTSSATSTLWISRVPETLTESKHIISTQYDNWESLGEAYKFIGFKSNYSGIDQRWLLVFSKEAYTRELLTLKKNYAKLSQKEYQDFLKLSRECFDCQVDAKKAFENFVKKCKYVTISDLTFKEEAVFEKRGRPKKDEFPTKSHYYIQASVYCQMDNFEKMAETKGRFIIATNEMNQVKLSDKALFETYKGQSKVERGFRFLKDPQFMASTFFVKKPERIEALLFIMTLCLTVYAAIEYRIRQSLKEQNQTLPNQLAKEVKNPTARWLFSCFIGIHVLYKDNKPIILNIIPLHLKILKLFGPHFNKYYLLE
jgi:transposase